MSPVPVTLAFPQSSLDAVTKCIEECEQQTSAEFRLIIERSIPSKGLRENITDAQRAKELFGRYGVWDTEDNNGVLIYLNLSDRAIEIYLDRGAAREVRQTQLDDIVKQMEIALLIRSSRKVFVRPSDHWPRFCLSLSRTNPFRIRCPTHLSYYNFYFLEGRPSFSPAAFLCRPVLLTETKAKPLKIRTIHP